MSAGGLTNIFHYSSYCISVIINVAFPSKINTGQQVSNNDENKPVVLLGFFSQDEQQQRQEAKYYIKNTYSFTLYILSICIFQENNSRFKKKKNNKKK